MNQMCTTRVVDDSIRSIKLDNYVIKYGDVTKDGVEEAMLARGFESLGSAIISIVYVYSLRNHQAEILWQFEAGDRAYGGLRAIYAHCGDLIVELNGPKEMGVLVAHGTLHEPDMNGRREDPEERVNRKSYPLRESNPSRKTLRHTPITAVR